MCGICGIWNYATRAPVDPDLMHAMTESIAHRGPDDSGVFFDDQHGLALGFRRLAIIDLSPAGHQPMGNEDGSVQIVFNGEIYNFLDLRPPLEACGHVFRSRSDTEIIIHHYEDHGADGIADLWGMFALALWDRSRAQLVFARDRLGKKPLYYYDDGKRIVFASELKAILRDPSIPRQLNYAGVIEYLQLGYIGAPHTILNGIRKLPPAHIMVHTGATTVTRRYWDWLPAFQTDACMSESEWSERLMHVFRDAVRIRMISDVPLGAFLSGGVDSSAVVAMMAGLSEQPVRTFSIGFRQESFSELSYARQIAERFATNHHEYIVEPEVLSDLLPKLVYQFDEPFGDSSSVPTYYVTKIARQEVTVCLSGDGGDEALAGYPRYWQALFEEQIEKIPQAFRKSGAALLMSLLPKHLRWHWLAQRQLLPAGARYMYGMQTFYSPQLRSMLTPELARQVPWLPEFLAATYGRSRTLDTLGRMQYLDGMTYLPEDILVKVDRTSMMNSLEVRCPLLDHRILELTAQIPASLRLHERQGKYIFKRSLRSLLPDNILGRRKQGFGIPGRAWLTHDLADMVHDLLAPEQVQARGLFRPDVVQRLVHRNVQAETDLWPQVWSLLVLELWCQQVIDR